MNKIKQQYSTNLIWSLVETVFFQGSLFIHQCALYKVTDPYFYGLVGTVFGCIYFGVKLCDLGLNKTLAPFFLDYSVSKKAFYRFFTIQLLPSVVIYSIICLSVLCTAYTIIPPSITIHLNTYTIITIMLIMGIELIKTSIKKVLQLSHHFSHTALCEIAFIISYQMAIWSYYWYNPLTISFVFSSFLLLSTIELICLIIITYKWYATLPSAHNLTHSSHWDLIIRNRFFSYGHSMGKQAFSANVLVPLFAYFFGLESAALLKLSSYFTHSITTIVEKIIAPSSAVLFAYTKNESPQNKQDFFSMASHTLYNLLLCILIFIIINHQKMFNVNHGNATALICAFGYFCIHYVENLFIVIERFYVTHNRSDILMISTFLNYALVIVVFLFSLSPLEAIMCLLFSRFLSFCILLFILSSLWNIRHTISINLSYIVGTVAASLLFFMVF